MLPTWPDWCTGMSNQANMLLDTRPGRPDHVYLADFGLSKAALNSAALTADGKFLGTADYISPEQIRDEPPCMGAPISTRSPVPRSSC